MINPYESIHLIRQETGYELINYVGTKIEPVTFKTELSQDDIASETFVKVKAVIDGVQKDGFIKLSSDVQNLERIRTLDPTEASKKINDYFFSIPADSSKEQLILKGLMHLGLSKESYDADPVALARSLFQNKGFLYETATFLGLKIKLPADCFPALDHLYEKLALSEVAQNWVNLIFIPEDKKTTEICKVAVAQNWRTLSLIPEDKKTTEICKVAVAQNWHALSLIPQDKKTTEICKVAVERSLVFELPPTISGLNYDEFVKTALEDRTEYFSKIASYDEHPHLLFIARLRQLMGDKWNSEDLRKMPISSVVCKHYNETLRDYTIPLEIRSEDFKLFTNLTALIYPEIVKEEESSLLNITRLVSENYDSYRKSRTTPSKDVVIQNFLTFNGLDPIKVGLDFSGNYEYISYQEIADSILESKKIPLRDRKHFSATLHDAASLRFLNTETVEKIKKGEFITIPVGYSAAPSGNHAVTIAFYKNEFIICNRGSRVLGTPVIQRFNYDSSKMNLDVLKFLIINKRLVFRDIKEAVIHQLLVLEIILPKILGANRIKESRVFSMKFKNQKVGNCTKASPMTAIKMGIYLKELEKGTPQREAALKAKAASDEVSYNLRQKSINKAKKLLTNPTTDSIIKVKLSKAIAKAEVKLIHKFPERR